MSSPVRTATTPGSSRARLASTRINRAWGDSLRKILAWSMPGISTLIVYGTRPVTRSRASIIPSFTVGLCASVGQGVHERAPNPDLDHLCAVPGGAAHVVQRVDPLGISLGNGARQVLGHLFANGRLLEVAEPLRRLGRSTDGH